MCHKQILSARKIAWNHGAEQWQAHVHKSKKLLSRRQRQVKKGKTPVFRSDRALKRDCKYEKRKKRKKFRRGAAKEPVIAHLKAQYRMQKNYLSGKDSAQINVFLAASAWNLKKLMKKLKEESFCLYFFLRKQFEKKHFF